jgi:hypothetical protein
MFYKGVISRFQQTFKNVYRCENGGRAQNICFATKYTKSEKVSKVICLILFTCPNNISSGKPEYFLLRYKVDTKVHKIGPNGSFERFLSVFCPTSPEGVNY